MKISVVIPTFNRRHRLPRAIESVLSQANVDLELIVVDDGSSDGTVEWLATEYPDPRLRVIHNTRKKGPAGARNAGILAASGDLVAFLDSDDIYLPGHLEASQRIFQLHPMVGLVFGSASYEQNGVEVDYMGPNYALKLAQAETTYSDAEHKVFDENYFTHLLKFGCYFNLSTVVLRTAAARCMMNEDLRIAEDYEFWVRLSRKFRFACLCTPQIIYLLHDQNISFESTGTAANAPNQLRAYEIMLQYEKLPPNAVEIIQQNMAEVLFDWGYRCRKHKKFREAIHHHLAAIALGKPVENLVAIVKTLALGLLSPFFSR